MRERIRRGIQEHPLISPILERASAKEARVFLVGGAIRDLALGEVPRDLDFATDHPYEMARFFAERYGSRIVSLGKESTPTYRIPLKNVRLDWVGLVDGSLERDLARRDFTIDAIAYEPDSGRLFDPTRGLEDLAGGCIRMASSSAFLEDPLRILKAFRLWAQLPDFDFDPETERALGGQAAGLMDAAPERIHSELVRLFEAPRPGEALSAMARLGALFVLVPELKRIKDLGQNDYHHTDVLNHTLEALALLDGPMTWTEELDLPRPTKAQRVVLGLSILFHDLGKVDTRSTDEEGKVHFYGHPKPSADHARAIMKRLCFSNADTENVASLCLNHLRPLGLIKTKPRAKAIRRLIHSMGDLLPLLLALAYADKSAARGRDMEANLRDLKALSREVMAVARREGESIRNIPKLLDGLDALAVLGMNRPGPSLGKALDALMDRQVEGTITTREEAVTFLKGWAARNLTPAGLDL